MKRPDASLTRDIAPFGLRMPPDLKARIQATAERNNRSMNAEIVTALESAYPAVGPEATFLFLFDELVDIAETGDELALNARCGQANLRLAAIGFDRVEFVWSREGERLRVAARSVDEAERNRRWQRVSEAAEGIRSGTSELVSEKHEVVGTFEPSRRNRR